MGRPQLVITIECDKDDIDKVPRNIFETVRSMVADIPSAEVLWSTDESDDDDSDDTYPTASCGCGFDLIYTADGWQHQAAPYLWGDDHDADPGPLDDATRLACLIYDLREEGMDSVADDLGAGVTAEVVLSRLKDIGEGDSYEAGLVRAFIDETQTKT